MRRGESGGNGILAHHWPTPNDESSKCYSVSFHLQFKRIDTLSEMMCIASAETEVLLRVSKHTVGISDHMYRHTHPVLA